MNYVFTMIGEFGYEVLNWHAIIRKWALYSKQEDDTITICSRNGLELFYEFADNYVNISQFDSYNKTIADVFDAYIVSNGDINTMPKKEWQIERHGQHISDIQEDVTNYITSELGLDNPQFIWSWNFTTLKTAHYDFHFGKQDLVYGGIYDPNLIEQGEFGAPLRIEENLFRKEP